MKMNAWWEGDSEQRFWVEITDREDLGFNLFSPQVGYSGSPTAGYESMKYVQPGDIVFHWWKQSGQKPAFVGWSNVVGVAQPEEITWKAHGRTAKGRKAKNSPAWEVPLEDFQNLSHPVTLAELQTKTKKFEKLLSELKLKHGDPIYFPFSFGSKTPMKTMQYYLTKLPKEFLELVPSMKEAITGLSSTQNPSPPKTKRTSASSTTTGGGYQQDPEKRIATDRQGIQVAKSWMEKQGYAVEVLGKPYDLHAVLEDEIVKVEIKSSIGSLTVVELTKNEVSVAENAGGSYRSLLLAVEGIELFQEKGAWVGRGGSIRVWWDWYPEKERLTAVKFNYLLPPLKVREQ